MTIPLDAGIAVRGPAVLAASVARALLLQVCLVHPPGRVRVADPVALSTVLAVAGELPHAHATAGAAVVVTDAAARVPAGADIPSVYIGEDDPVPPRCAAVLTLAGGDRGRLDHDGSTRSVQVEAVSAAQAAEIASALAARAHGLGHRTDEATLVDDLAVDEPRPGSLRCPLGVSAGEVVSLDLVTDGPHAVVIGTTGSGKSELLCTWAAGMCRGRDATEVALLLVDFKGGRAFDALAALPHVTGVLTDLDEQAAVRAVESLRAEIRHRERTLAAHAAKDIDEAVGALPRLVIVVDEYAALINAHPELHELFADVAARGRALGMHLVLASQRATGAFRDAVLANAPLRIALRTTDAADSRLVLGTDDAVRLSGRPEGRGIALIRGAADDEPRRLRVARCTARALEAIRSARGICAGALASAGRGIRASRTGRPPGTDRPGARGRAGPAASGSGGPPRGCRGSRRRRGRREWAHGGAPDGRAPASRRSAVGSGGRGGRVGRGRRSAAHRDRRRRVDRRPRRPRRPVPRGVRRRVRRPSGAHRP
ncbi:FtsK/SpoIIIE domain-containing protein [Microbacterium hominis]|uniref:FtsK/SpoIIIE domain-containing protein n=1 Tax=Microbacterium hominis TaxID=162426 RepID=UPI0007688E4C|nr:FtsK/SpoIIIE domain-containing protein [Microbacterium hominis]KXC06770.1 hypothetical protein MhomT_03560 [Microbacterium hominis]